jgi:hypothetical protein
MDNPKELSISNLSLARRNGKLYFGEHLDFEIAFLSFYYYYPYWATRLQFLSIFGIYGESVVVVLWY